MCDIFKMKMKNSVLYQLLLLSLLFFNYFGGSYCIPFHNFTKNKYFNIKILNNWLKLKTIVFSEESQIFTPHFID